jgi:arsenite transporter
VERLERHQLWVYVAAILAGLGLGTAVPDTGPVLELAVWPTLGLLLYATFTQVPLTHLPVAFRDVRFIGAVVIGNFVVLPLVVWGLLWLAPADPAVRFGILLVLLVPCTDWFITFTHLAGGDSRRAIAITPVNLVLQLLLLPLYLWLFLGQTFTQLIGATRGLTVFVLLILLPLGAAWATQHIAQGERTGTPGPSGHGPRRGDHRGMMRLLGRLGRLPVPLLAVVVFLVAATQVTTVTGTLELLPQLALVYGAFLVVAAGAGRAVAALFRLDVAASRTVIFSYGTRNSFVVLPIALAVPEGWQVAVVVVVFQSLVELVGMVAYLWAVPRLVPTHAPAPEADRGPPRAT